MLPPLPFHGRELAELLRPLPARVGDALAVLAAVATAVAFIVLFTQLLAVPPPRIA